MYDYFYLTKTTGEYLKSGNDLALRHKPEDKQLSLLRNIEITLPYKGLQLALNRLDVDDFDHERGYGDKPFDQMQVVVPGSTMDHSRDEALVISVGVGVDPLRRLLQAPLPEHLRRPLAAGQIAMAGMSLEGGEGMLTEVKPNEALPRILDLAKILKGLAAQNNVQ